MQLIGDNTRVNQNDHFYILHTKGGRNPAWWKMAKLHWSLPLRIWSKDWTTETALSASRLSGTHVKHLYVHSSAWSYAGGRAESQSDRTSQKGWDTKIRYIGAEVRSKFLVILDRNLICWSLQATIESLAWAPPPPQSTRNPRPIKLPGSVHRIGPEQRTIGKPHHPRKHCAFKTVWSHTSCVAFALFQGRW